MKATPVRAVIPAWPSCRRVIIEITPSIVLQHIGVGDRDGCTCGLLGSITFPCGVGIEAVAPLLTQPQGSSPSVEPWPYSFVPQCLRGRSGHVNAWVGNPRRTFPVL